MSEINSIANGTFTIGQTSATNFQAGPGIKIDEPSAGTVRIGNDETVLWEGTLGATGTYIPFSEDVSGFERLKLFGVAKTNSDGRARTIGEYEVNYNTTDNNCLIYFPLCNRGAGTTTQNLMYIELSGNSAHLLAGDKWVGSTYTNNVSTYDFNLVKVVGVNRKEV